jgi:SecD/SecF fusion protein
MLGYFSTPLHLFIAQAEAGSRSLSGGVLFLLLVLAVALGIFLARVLTAQSQLGDFRKRMSIVLVTVLIACLMVWSKWPPRFGVDLRGGINMVGSLNLDEWATSDANGGSPTASSIIPALIQRVNPGGVAEIMIRPLGTDKIEVTIPSVDMAEANSIWERLTKAGKLEFRIIADAQYAREHGPALNLARKQAEAGSRTREVFDVDSEGKRRVVAMWTTLAREVSPTARPGEILPIKHVPSRGNLVRDRSTGRIIESDQILTALGPNPELHGRDFARWAADRGIRSPQILVLEPEERLNVEGRHLYKVSTDMDERGRACVSFVTTDEGTYRMLSFTKQNVGRLMATILDDQLHSAATIQEAISKNGRITGSFTPEEVEEMVINLQSGKLPVALNKVPISQNFINSTLGQELKEKGIYAIVASLIIVMIFMVVYYRGLGLFACFALGLNGLLVFALVMAIEQPLTLTGLAGLVLTIGMAVDANVLIFERIREEINRGAAIRMAIRNGFDKAMSTIVDSNVTTIVTALALYLIGTEQLKGFSVTLILGILCSMFTAIYVGRLVLEWSERKRWLTQANMMHLLEKKEWNFLSAFRLTSVISLAVILTGITALFSLGGRILDQDLRGGSTARIVFNQPISIDEVRSRLGGVDMVVNGEKIDFTVSSFGSDNQAIADTEYKIDSNLQAWEGEGERFKQLDEILDEVFAGELKKNSVQVVERGVPTEQSGSPAAAEQSSLRRKYQLDSVRSWTAAPALAGLAAPGLSVGLLFQEPGSEPATSEEPAGETPPGAASGQQDPEAAPAQNPEQDRGQLPDLDPVLPGDDAPESEPASGGDFQPAPRAEINVESVNAVRTLQFEHRIAGKGVRELLVRASQEVQLPLDEDQIEVETSDVKTPDQSQLGTESTQWKVTMKVNREEDADTIINAWKADFNQKTYFPTSSKVGSQIAESARWQALAAIIASLIGIIIYVWIRFQNVAFGLAAVAALVHDVLIVLGALAVSHWLTGSLQWAGIMPFKISLEIVAAILTVIGYSLNDTIVIFDRIREVRGKQTKITREMLNTSISQTLSRTIITSLTTFLVVFILYWFGGDAIHGFAFALCVGIIAGTYSTMFIACPILLWLMNSVGLNPGEVERPSSVSV